MIVMYHLLLLQVQVNQEVLVEAEVEKSLILEEQVMQEDPEEDLEALILQGVDQQGAQEILPLQTHRKVMLVVQVLLMALVP